MRIKTSKKLIRKYLKQIRKEHKIVIKNIKTEIMNIGKSIDTYDDYLYLVNKIEYYEVYFNLSQNEINDLYKFLDKQVYDKYINYWKFKDSNENVENIDYE